MPTVESEDQNKIAKSGIDLTINVKVVHGVDLPGHESGDVVSHNYTFTG